MTPFWEKVVMIALSVAIASLAHLFADDPAVRGLMLMLAGAPGGMLIPRAEERQLKRQSREPPPPPSS